MATYNLGPVLLIPLIPPSPADPLTLMQFCCDSYTLLRSLSRTRQHANKQIFDSSSSGRTGQDGKRNRERDVEGWKGKGPGREQSEWLRLSLDGGEGVPYKVSTYLCHLHRLELGFRLSEPLFNQLLPGVCPDRRSGESSWLGIMVMWAAVVGKGRAFFLD